MKYHITHISTATVLIEIGPIRILTDPVFDPPGKRYHFGYGTSSKKLEGPAISPDEIGPIDLILLSHDHHQDNLDTLGRKVLDRAGQVISTKSAKKRLKRSVVGLDPWESIEINNKIKLRITATPALHGTLGVHRLAGPVIGFIVEFPDSDSKCLYITGDTVWFDGLREVAEGFDIGTLLVHLGGVQFPLMKPFRFTFNSKEAIKLALICSAQTVIPVHYDGWSHFRENEQAVRAAFMAEVALKNKIRWLEKGQRTEMVL